MRRHLPLLSTALFAAAVAGQAEPVTGTRMLLAIDSGYVANRSTSPATAAMPQVVWSTVVSSPGASWLRLQYAGVLLAGANDRGGDGSFVRITSLRDGFFQTQHLVHIAQWQETSAYFNGDSVLVELLAHQQTGDNRLMIGALTAGPVTAQPPDTICGPTDDRALSNDPRVARLMPIGCTGWLIDDCAHCLLTAGHCTTSSLQVAQFNVPLSTAGGATQNPPPQHQYALDPASLQTNGGLGVGNDWGYFGVFANSTSGLTPYASQGNQAFMLSMPPAVSAGLNIRVTGCGSTSSPVSPTWYLVQKTHVGPYASFSASTVNYVTDTTGGNSGSPVILENTGAAIGIHTHGGCTSTGGANAGTGNNHAGLQAALANPQGVCICAGLTFTFPNGRPASVQPDGTTVVRVVVGSAGQNPPQPGTGTLHYGIDGTFTNVAMTSVSPNVYDATFPRLPCFSTVRYYFSARDTASAVFTEPRTGPGGAFSAQVANSLTIFRDYDFNTAPPGWTVFNTNVATGAWVRGTPAGGGVNRDPPTDYDGSGQCWVTGLGANVDVDGGPTELRTELFNLTGANDPVLSYARWMSNDDADDFLVVQVSETGGASWVTLETVGTTPSGWVARSFRLRNHISSLSQVVVRFSVADQPNNSVTEAAIDAFKIQDMQCQQPTYSAFGLGCAGSAGLTFLIPAGVPALGSTFTLNVFNTGSGLPVMLTGLSNTAWAGGPLPASLAPFGFGPACNLLVAADAIEVLGSQGGQALWHLAIPNSQALAGLQFFNQAAVLDVVPGVTAGGAGEIR